MNLSKLERSQAIAILDSLVREDSFRESNYELMVRTLLLQLFISLSRRYERTALKPMTGMDNEAALFDTVCAFTKQHYAQPLSLKQISQLCNMSQTTFTSKFKQQIGMTFIAFRNRIRLREAKKLLETSAAKIVAISLEVGFEDLSFFNRMFKREFGITPSAYRDNFRRSLR